MSGRVHFRLKCGRRLVYSKAYSTSVMNLKKQRERKLEVELQSRPKIWQLSTVYVVPKYRRQGIGSSLVNQVLKRQASSKQRGRNVYALASAKTILHNISNGYAVMKTDCDEVMNDGNLLNLKVVELRDRLECTEAMSIELFSRIRSLFR